MIWLLPHPIPPRPSASCLSFSIFLCVPARAFWRERGKGVGEEPNHTTTRKLGPLLIIQYSVGESVVCVRVYNRVNSESRWTQPPLTKHKVKTWPVLYRYILFVNSLLTNMKYKHDQSCTAFLFSLSIIYLQTWCTNKSCPVPTLQFTLSILYLQAWRTNMACLVLTLQFSLLILYLQTWITNMTYPILALQFSLYSAYNHEIQSFSLSILYACCVNLHLLLPHTLPLSSCTVPSFLFHWWTFFSGGGHTVLKQKFCEREKVSFTCLLPPPPPTHTLPLRHASLYVLC